MIDPTTQKVLERFTYERLLLTTGIEARKRRITLDEVLAAGEQEPRIFEALPGALYFNPKVVLNIQKGLKKYPKVKAFVETFLTHQVTQDNFYEIPLEDCRKAALTYQAYLKHKKQQNRSRLFNLRLSEKDWQQLVQVSEKMETHNHSETIRQLIQNALLADVLKELPKSRKKAYQKFYGKENL